MILRALILLVLLLPFPAAAHAARVVDPGEYRRVVADALGLVRSAQLVDGAQREQRAEAARARLLEVESVQLRDGTTVVPSNTPALEALAESPPDLDRAAAQLAALEAALARMPLEGHQSDSAAAQTLRDVLARPEFFRGQRPSFGFLEPILGPLLGILDALIEFVGQQYLRALQFLSDVLAGRVSPETVAAIVLAIGALVLSVIFVLRRISNIVAAEVSQTERAAPGARPRAAQAWNQAGECAAAGDYRGAIRMLYLATLLTLDEAGQLRFERALTNREHLRHAPKPLLQLLEPLVERYDRLWYGQSRLHEADYRAFRELAARLREAA